MNKIFIFSILILVTPFHGTSQTFANCVCDSERVYIRAHSYTRELMQTDTIFSSFFNVQNLPQIIQIKDCDSIYIANEELKSIYKGTYEIEKGTYGDFLVLANKDFCKINCKYHNCNKGEHKFKIINEGKFCHKIILQCQTGGFKFSKIEYLLYTNSKFFNKIIDSELKTNNLPTKKGGFKLDSTELNRKKLKLNGKG